MNGFVFFLMLSIHPLSTFDRFQLNVIFKHFALLSKRIILIKNIIVDLSTIYTSSVMRKLIILFSKGNKDQCKKYVTYALIFDANNSASCPV